MGNQFYFNSSNFTARDTGRQLTDEMANVYKQFYVKLVNTLPMDDVTFIASLYSRDLLPGDTKLVINSLSTQAEKAAYFLDHVIEPLVGFSRLNKLLEVMENSGYSGLKELATLMTTALMKGAVTTDTG